MRAVSESSRSHYDRKDLQRLFAIQARSAQHLIATMPSVAVGRARLVEREELLRLLTCLDEAADPTEVYAKLRGAGGRRVRRQLRTLSLQDNHADLDAPPTGLSLCRGELKLQFQSLEQLAEILVYLATILRDDVAAFASRYEPVVDLENLRQKQRSQMKWTTTDLSSNKARYQRIV